MPNLLFVALLSPLALADAPVGPPGTPSPADMDRAKQLFENGADLYEEASYREAIAAWTEAYRLSGKPDLLYNIANAHERLAEYGAAIDAIQTYRAFATSEERELLDRRLRNLEKLLTDQQQRAQPSPSPSPSPEPVVGRAPAPEPVARPRGGSGRRTAGLVLVGVGGVGLGSAGVLGALSAAAGNRAEAPCVDGLCPDTIAPDLRANRSLALLSDVSLVAGLASAGVGVGLVVTGGRDTALVVGPGRVGLIRAW
jgi:tetratricopeptide (TPR) repeat protein